MITAMAGLARSRGVADVTVAQVVAEAGVSRRTFYELFEDRNDCFAAAFDQGIARAAARIAPAYEAARGWRAQMRAGLGGLLAFLEEEPDLGALCVVIALGASPIVVERRNAVVGALTKAVDGGRREVRGSAKPAPLMAEGVVGAVLSVLHARLAAGEAVASLEGSLMGIVTLPYLGPAAAAQETVAAKESVARTAARSPAVAAAVSGNPLRDLGMRLTYRTAQTVVAIGDLAAGGSGPSNREVADAAGISDQGQISKLLTRLEHLGLVHNGQTESTRGAPNTWRLTPKGAEIAQIIRLQGT